MSQLWTLHLNKAQCVPHEAASLWLTFIASNLFCPLQVCHGQLMKCNFFSLVAATPDAMGDTSLRSLAVCHNAKAANS